MKKLTAIIIMLLLLPMSAVYAQHTEDTEHEPVYFIITSTTNKNISEGISRSSLKRDEVYENDEPIFFTYRSKSKNVRVSFLHVDYNLYQIGKEREIYWNDSMEIRTEPATFIDNNPVIDMEQLFDALTKEEIWEYSEGLQNKRVYIIDRNPEFGEANNETVRLIQVILTSNNRPQNPLIIVNE